MLGSAATTASTGRLSGRLGVATRADAAACSAPAPSRCRPRRTSSCGPAATGCAKGSKPISRCWSSSPGGSGGSSKSISTSSNGGRAITAPKLLPGTISRSRPQRRLGGGGPSRSGASRPARLVAAPDGRALACPHRLDSSEHVRCSDGAAAALRRQLRNAETIRRRGGRVSGKLDGAARATPRTAPWRRA